MDMELRGKVAVITGGNTGIGLAIALGLAREGVQIVLVARNRERLEMAAAEVRAQTGAEALAVVADVVDAGAAEMIGEAVARAFGGTDILINNAGEGTNETIMEAPDAKWLYYWDLHVMAAVRLARALVPQMRQRGGGVIVNNASICAKQPLGHEPIYNVTKAALVMLTKCLANELIGDNIRVNAINPGLIMTEGWITPAKQITAASGGDWEAYLQGVAAQYAPIKRFATPEELADFFVFLCSPRASYCVGSTYYVDGGWLNVVA